jgi:hypothetical protein
MVGTSCGFSVPLFKFEGHRKYMGLIKKEMRRVLTCMFPGELLTKFAENLEKNDRKADDPFSLPMHKGLKSYWVHFNTWSMDGLPGFKQVSGRTNKGAIHSVMRDVGLNPKTATRKVFSEWFVVLFVGVVIGFFLATAVNGNVSTAANSLIR